jgi:hypothetical protein
MCLCSVVDTMSSADRLPRGKKVRDSERFDVLSRNLTFTSGRASTGTHLRDGRVCSTPSSGTPGLTVLAPLMLTSRTLGGLSASSPRLLLGTQSPTRFRTDASPMRVRRMLLIQARSLLYESSTGEGRPPSVIGGGLNEETAR